MITQTMQVKSKAMFSDNGEHRLLLRHEWDKEKKSAMVIMIQPHNADTLSLDLTTMLVINNLKNLGFGAVNIVNLYSRIMEKLQLRFNSDEDLIDAECDRYIEQYASMSDAIIIAWGSVGNNTQRVRERQKEVLTKLSAYKNRFYKIGLDGCHPLTPAVRNQWDLEPYEMEELDNAKNNQS